MTKTAFRAISLSLLLSTWCFADAGGGDETVVVPSSYRLSAINWETSSHLRSDTVFVGGYSRYPAVGWDEEGLLVFDVSAFPSGMNGARLELDVVGGMTNGIKEITLYAQDLRDSVDTASVSYGSFCASQYDCGKWNRPLASAMVDASDPGTIRLTSPELLDSMSAWRSRGEGARTLVLAADFHTRSYRVALANIRIVVTEASYSSSANASSSSFEPQTYADTTVTFAASRYPLVQTNWDGSSHLTSRYISIGGYARYQPFGYEMLLDFDVPDLGSEIIDARINVKIAENTTNSSQRLFLYAQDKDSAWDSSTVTYDTFGREPWDDILAVAVVPDSRVSEVAFSGGALTARINRWMKDPESNRGLIVAGGFGHWDSYVIADSVTVELVYREQADSSTATPGAHARVYSHSFEHGNMISNWSFENVGGWEIDTSRAQYGLRTGQSGKVRAKSGTHFATVTASPAPGAPSRRLLSTGMIPVTGNAIYSLTLHYIGQSNGAPKVEFSRCESCPAEQAAVGDPYVKVGAWQRIQFSFVPPQWATYMRVVPLSGDAALSASLLLDDIVLEEVDPMEPRGGRIGESVGFYDAFGREHQASALAESATVHGNRIGTCLESRLVYARKSLVSGNRSVLFGGVVTSEGNIAIGADARVSADLHAFGDVELFNRASVKGDVRAGDDIVMHPEASISAQTVTQEDGEIPSCSMLSDGPWPESYQDVSVPLDTTTELSPGSYRDLSTAYGYRPAILRLRHGVYSFRNIRWFSASRIEADLSGGDIEVYVSDSLLLGYGTVVSAVNSAFANELTFHVLGDAEVSDDARVAANIVSDEANVRIGNRVLVEGRIVGGMVVIGEDCVVSAPRAFEPSSRFASYVNVASEFDEQGRKKRETLPFLATMASLGVLESPVEEANSFYDAFGPYGDAGGFAYSESKYVQDEPGDRLAARSAPGEAWTMDNRPTRFGFRFVSSLDIPSVLTESADTSSAHPCDTIVYGLLRPIGTNCPDAFELSWKIGSQGLAELSWRDSRGLERQRALVPSREDSLLAVDSALIRRFDYYQNGTLRRELTPLDLSSGDSSFAGTRAYDAAGRLSLVQSKDGGRVRFVRDRSGRARFSQDDRQREAGIWTYNEYDGRGRLVSIGTQSFASEPTIAQADSASSRAPKTERILRYYGQKGLDDAKARFPFLSNVSCSNVGSRLAVRVALNPDVHLPSVLSQSQKTPIVADLFSYDSLGRIKTETRFDGMGDGPGKYSSLTYEYDLYGRRKGDAFRLAADRDPVLTRDFAYDDQGRISSISERGGPRIAEYAYDDLGQLKASRVGNALEQSYRIRFSGGVVGLDVREAGDGNPVFSQEMFYENADTALGMKPRFDGRLAGEMLLRDSLLSDAGELRAYDYDSWDRLSRRSVSKRTGGEGWVPEPAQGETVLFDGNGRIVEKGANGAPLTGYFYGEGAYRPSGAGNDGTLSWDKSGRLVADSSKRMSVLWGEGNRPTAIAVVGEESDSTQINNYVYDADGRRTAIVSSYALNGNPQADTVLVSVVRDVRISGHRAREIAAPGQQTVTEVTLRGATGSAGKYIASTGQREYLVRDLRGSVVRTVDANGHAGSWGFRYGVFGVRGDLAASSATRPPREQYTGHELDATTGLLYFGARYYDPELGLWLSPDPASQFANPYSPMGGDPVNYVDPDGESILAAAIIGAVVGAYFGGVSATGSYTWEGFDVTEDWDEVLVGGISGAAGGAAGAAAGAYAASLGAGTGATVGMASGSTANTVTHWALSGGRTDVSTSFGGASVNWNKLFSGDMSAAFGYVGKSGNSSMQNVSYALGLMGNVMDVLSFAGATYARATNETNGAQHNIPENYSEGPTGDNWFHSNYIGPDNPANGELLPLTSDSDLNALYHDYAYDLAGASGPKDALLNASPEVISADFTLAGSSLLTLLRVRNTFVNAPMTAWSVIAPLAIAPAFTTIATYKSILYLQNQMIQSGGYYGLVPLAGN